MVKYEVDKAHTTVGFTAKHLAVSTVRGQFNKFDASFEGPEDDPTKITGQIRIEVASVDTRTEMRDNHLRSADFFEAEKYPYITFKLNRMDFGLNWDGIAGAIPIASHTIKLDIESEIVVKAAELAQA